MNDSHHINDMEIGGTDTPEDWNYLAAQSGLVPLISTLVKPREKREAVYRRPADNVRTGSGASGVWAAAFAGSGDPLLIDERGKPLLMTQIARTSRRIALMWTFQSTADRSSP